MWSNKNKKKNYNSTGSSTSSTTSTTNTRNQNGNGIEPPPFMDNTPPLGRRNNNNNTNQSNNNNIQKKKNKYQQYNNSSNNNNLIEKKRKVSNDTLKDEDSEKKPELPGYYYDKEKDRYFKITKENKQQAEAINKKREQEESGIKQPKEIIDDHARANCTFNRMLMKREIRGSRDSTRRNICLSCKLNQVYMMERNQQQSTDPGWKYHHTEEYSSVEPLFEQQSISIVKDSGGLKQSVQVARGVVCTNHRTNTLGNYWIGVEDITDRGTIMQDNNDEIVKRLNNLSLVSSNSNVMMYSLISSTRAFGGQIAVSNLGDGSSGSVQVLSQNDYRFERSAILTDSSAWTCEWHPSGMALAVGGSGFLHLWDMQSVSFKSYRTGKSDIFSLAFNQDGSLLCMGSRDSSIQFYKINIHHQSNNNINNNFIPRNIFDDDSNRPMEMIPLDSKLIKLDSSICSLKFLRNDDSHLLVSMMNGVLMRWDRKSNRMLTQYHHHSNSHSLIKLSTDETDTFLCSGGEDKRVRVWSISSGHLLYTFGPFNQIIQSSSIINHWFNTSYISNSIISQSLPSTPPPINFNNNTQLDTNIETNNTTTNNNQPNIYYEPIICFSVNDGLILKSIY